MSATSPRWVRWLVGLLLAGALAMVAGGLAMELAGRRFVAAGAMPDVRIAIAVALGCGGAAVAIATSDRARRGEPALRLWFLVLGWATFALLAGQAVATFIVRSQIGGYLPFSAGVLLDSVPVVVLVGSILMSAVALTWPRMLVAADSAPVIVDVVVGTLALAIVWFLVVVPALPPRTAPVVAADKVHASLLEFIAIVIVLTLAATARRRGALPIVQVILIQLAVIISVLGSVTADALPIGAQALGVLVASGGFVIAAALLALMALRGAQERELPRQLWLRDAWSSFVPLSPVPLAAGTLLVTLAAGRAPTTTAVITLAVILGLVIGGVLWLRLAARRELRRAAVVRAATTFSQATDQPWFQALIENGRDLVVVVDRANRIVYCSPSFCRLIGLAAAGLVGRSLKTVVPDLTGTVVRSAPGLPDRPAQPVDAVVIDHTGSEHEVQFHVAPLQGLGAEGYVLTGQDVTDTRRLRRLVGDSGRRDRRTGLLNDEGFGEAVQEALALSDPRTLVIVNFDIVDFRALNDTYGRRAGAALLRAVAAELERAPGPIVAVGRVSAAGFAVLLRDAAPDVVAAAFAEHLRGALRRVDIPGRTSLTVRLAIGYASSAFDSGSARELVEHAALAASSSLARPRHPLVRFEFEMREQALREWEQLSAIETALAERQFIPYYQPIVRLSDGAVVAVEVLARRRLADGSVELPEEFIPPAERLGQVGRIDAAIRAAAFTDFAAVQRRSAGLVVSLNIAPSVFDEDFARMLMSEVRSAGVNPSGIMFELTESTVASSPHVAVDVVRHLRSNGHAVALDDFGTGFSSLSLMRDLQVDVLKFDRVFTSDLATSGRALALMRAMIDIGRGLDVITVAEGVRTVEQADLLRGMGCDRGQGFLYSEPLALPELLTWLDTRSTGAAPASADAP